MPEISLTPQTVARFRARFDRVAVLHSHLSDVERHEHWQRIARGEVEVVVGARSAIFAPTPHLGLIVLDEEHEIDVQAGIGPAVSCPRRGAAAGGRPERAARAGQRHAVAGKLAPGAAGRVSSWWRCRAACWIGRCRPCGRSICATKCTASTRAARSAGRCTGRWTRRLRDGGQVILLLNRRGHSTHIQCPACGHALRCPALRPGADVSPARQHGRLPLLRLPRGRARRRARHASSPGMRFSGLGTQKLEAEVRARFPDYACLRMDTDSMRGRGSHEQALAAFRDGKVRILLGTQMIAKGLDFPNVTLVGVVNADTALHLPDFRAAERTFQLVTQVAGRTGRGGAGRARAGADALPRCAGDRGGGAARPGGVRQPGAAASRGARLSAVCVDGAHRGSRRRARPHREALAEEIGERLHEHAEARRLAVRILGPAPAPIAKLRGQLSVSDSIAVGRRRAAARASCEPRLQDLKAPDGVAWIVDVDPLDMM